MVGWKKHLERAIELAGSQGRLAKLMGCSQAKVSWLLVTADDISAEDALSIDRASNGAVSASELRPDIWTSPKHVPRPAGHSERVAS